MYKTLRGQTAGTFKTQKLLDQEYLVIPVVAMVEGVRFGANQTSAELGLASEFGHFPDTWNNRPIVLGHPQVDGNFVSAGSPAVMDKYCIGTTMAAHVKDKKLKLEAWLNTALEDKSDESKRMFERIRANEQIEVSVGFFTDVEEKEGEFNGQVYSGIWRNIATDHLAFLEEGTIGACSIEDGCGAPRLNQNKGKNMSLTDKVKSALKTTGLNTTALSSAARAAKGVDNLTKPKTQCGCSDKGGKVLSLQTLDFENPKDPMIEVSVKHLHGIQSLIAQAIPDGLMSSDVETALSAKLEDLYIYAWVLGFTQSVAVYQAYVPDEGWCLYQQAFDIDADGAVTFTADPVEVSLITRIVPKAESESEPTVNSNDVKPATQNKETTMPKDATTQEGANATDPNAATTTETPAAETTETAPVVAPAAQAKKALTINEYLAEAPPELREVLAEGHRLQMQRKTQLIKSLQDSGRCKFDEAYLKSQSLAILENLAALAVVPADYAGAGGSVNTQESEEKIPDAPKALTRKTA